MKPIDHIAFLSTGSNMGYRAANLRKAATIIASKVGSIAAISHLYETAAWGNTDQKSFYNQVIQLNTKLTAFELIQVLLDIEIEMGRKRQEKWGPRKIDVDILFYDNEIIDAPGLTVPHPQIENRKFVLAPLVELAPDFTHPSFNKSVAYLLENCQDPLTVKRLNKI